MFCLVCGGERGVKILLKIYIFFSSTKDWRQYTANRVFEDKRILKLAKEEETGKDL